MSITSFPFFAFVAAVIIIYYFCVPKKIQWVVLLLASYAFYYFAGAELFVYILFTTLTVYGSALWIKKIQSPTGKKLVIALVTIFNFGLLAFFKWYNAIAEASNGLLARITDGSFRLPPTSLLLPLGISFYTFQAVGYLIDVYREEIEPERNLARFALFVSFFPQLVQGPISRHSDLAKQLYEPRKLDYSQFRQGFQLVIWGLFKKLVIADRIVLVQTEIFGDTARYRGLYILIGLITSAIQLYTDFSGGVDIARGAAQTLGIVMPENFRRPFFAASLPDYWRRWHMSLNEWWRDYLFYPLAFSKAMTGLGQFVRKHIGHELGKVISVYICINVVRVINALWHGASMTYIASGFSNGILIVLAMILAPVFKKVIKILRINTNCGSWKFFQIIRTFIIVCLIRVFSGTGSVSAGFSALKSIAADFNPWIINYDTLSSVGLSARDARIVLFSLAALLTVSILQERGMEIRKTLDRQNIAFQWMLTIGGMLIVLLWGKYGLGYDPADFIYGGF